VLKTKIVAATLLALCASGIALAAPAQASPGQVEGGCDTWAGHLEGRAHFNRDDATGWRNWYLFAGKITGQVGNSNNVNFYFYQDYQQHWTHWSPDNVRKNQWHYANANINMPPWSIQFAGWEGVFDVAGGDPSCFDDSDPVTG
jgi:hypothetical protein